MKPVAWRIFRNNRWGYYEKPGSGFEDRASWQPLYTGKPEWVGLTDEQIEDLFMRNDWCDDFAVFEPIARAVEQILKEKNK